MNKMPTELNPSFVTGLAGSGKSHALRVTLALDPSAFILTSTTGLSSVNLGVATLNSTLHYFDTDSLMDQYVRGHLYHTIRRLVTGNEKVFGLAIDEISMMSAQQLDIIYDTFVKVCKRDDVNEPLQLVLTGDFAQLPPVKERFAFEANCWPLFEANMVKLTKVWRQDNPLFLEALNAFRKGDGLGGVDLLKQCGVGFTKELTRFKGTTIVPTNDIADRYNKVLFDENPSPIFTIPTRRTGVQSSDWKAPRISDKLELKVGSLVMILANDPVFKSYANGDQGTVLDYDESNGLVRVRLISSMNERDGKEVLVPCITRSHTERMKDPMTGQITEGRVIAGTVNYMPLRLAYASTVHRSQGLSLDNVQIDFRDKFFGNPGSMYVALSRCRTPEGLRLVGNELLMARRTNINPLVKRFL